MANVHIKPIGLLDMLYFKSKKVKRDSIIDATAVKELKADYESNIKAHERHPGNQEFVIEDIIIRGRGDVRSYVLRKKDGTLGKWAIEVKPNSQSAYLDKMGNVIYPPAPKKKTQKALAKWQEKCQVIRRNSEKWDAAKRWAAKRGFKFAVKTENEIFGLAGEKGRV